MNGPDFYHSEAARRARRREFLLHLAGWIAFAAAIYVMGWLASVVTGP